MKKIIYYFFLFIINFSAGGIMGYFLNELVSVGPLKSVVAFTLSTSFYIMLANISIILLWLICPGHMKDYGGCSRLVKQFLLTFWTFGISTIIFFLYFH